jgi:hypothetical protein
MIDPVGKVDAPILLVGDAPDHDDLMKNMPFVSKRGDVLRDELGRVGSSLQGCRITFLHRHAIAEDCTGHLTDLLREMQNRKAVLLIGADTCKPFGITDVSKYCGLTIEHFLIPRNCGFVMVTVNPPQKDAIGEFRLSLEKFARRIRQ